jgi:hypothetical protein
VLDRHVETGLAPRFALERSRFVPSVADHGGHD